jgi:hypothetical protein
MYDGDKVKTYSAAGKLNWKFGGGPKAEYDKAMEGKKAAAPVEVLSQHRHYRRNQDRAAHHAHHRHHRNNGRAGADTFDHDPDTTSMYDDQHVYGNAGEYKASFQGPSKAKALMQHRLRARDSFDFDPTTTSMYDDTFKYSAPGALDWQFAGGPKAEYDAA